MFSCKKHLSQYTPNEFQEGNQINLTGIRILPMNTLTNLVQKKHVSICPESEVDIENNKMEVNIMFINYSM